MEDSAASAASGHDQRWRSRAKVGGLLAAGALAGAVLAGAIPAVAGTGSGSTTDSSPTGEPTPGSAGTSETNPTPGTERKPEDCPPGGPGDGRGPRPDRNGSETPDGETPDQPTPEQTPASDDTTLSGWRT
jgi:hypothetical protein